MITHCATIELKRFKPSVLDYFFDIGIISSDVKLECEFDEDGEPALSSCKVDDVNISAHSESNRDLMLYLDFFSILSEDKKEEIRKIIEEYVEKIWHEKEFSKDKKQILEKLREEHEVNLFWAFED
jgi:hypothetical protein